MPDPGRGSAEFWQWFDLMPRAVREALNTARTQDELRALWTAALREHGPGVRQLIDRGARACYNEPGRPAIGDEDDDPAF